MKKHLLLAATTATIATATVSAAVTINGLFGELLDASGTALPDGGLVALVVDLNNDGTLLGGLGANQSLTSSNSAAAHSAFAGQTIQVGNFGDEYILAVSETNGTEDFGIAGFWNYALRNLETSTAPAGALIGLYWFPGLTLASNTVGTNNFEIGGFNESILKDPGTADMVLPGIGDTVTISATTATAGGSVPTDRFQAITATAVPEPSSALLAFAGLAIPVLRRRRA